MRCPYLKDASVKYCRVSAFKKMILQVPGQAEQERCSTPGFVDCTMAQKQGGLLPFHSSCPYLQESPAQYCSAAPLTRFIPYRENHLSPCGGEGHRYCEFFLGIDSEDQPVLSKQTASEAIQAGADGRQEDFVEGMEFPRRLAYSTNHMWLDIAAEGSCHIGVDALLPKVFGGFEKLNFMTVKGVSNPSVVLTVQGIDLPMIFPNRMLITRTNEHLRAKPEKLASAPYTLGWLFEGSDMQPGKAGAGLMHGMETRLWIHQEVGRISEFVQSRLLRSLSPRERRKVLKTGLGGDLMRRLCREEIVCLFEEFFAHQADRK
jgi:glycine cleavage system H lipoate-binding protein